jgi:ATP-dependent DNA helicase RecQ
MDKETVLKDIFGFYSFRSNQAEIIDNILNENNKGLLVVMPTAAGKSILYQLSALLMGGLSIVISPLISLMKDQVDYLKSKNIAAEFYNSSLLESEKKIIHQKLMRQELKLLYVAPERFGDQRFTQTLKMTNKIELFAVDEAHCISTWGHDFRPSYRLIKDAIAFLEPKQTIALTATATKRVQNDICKQLNIPNAKKYVTGFYRPDLSLHVKTCNSSSKIDHIIKRTSQFIHMGLTTGIIYSPTRKLAEDIHYKLKNENINTTLYHAGLSDSVREKTQSDWFKNGGIVVATIAFALGIDKPDVRFILHAGLPSSLENYYQEIGRASRDGKGAKCIIFFDQGKDIDLQKFFIEMSYPPSYSVKDFWTWCCNNADKNNMILKTQKEMSGECKSFMKDFHVGGCVAKLRENEFIETIANGKYKINIDKDIENDFDFVKLEINRQIRFDTLYEMSDFANNSRSCRMVQILNYFEDNLNLKECGRCDVCIEKMLKNRPV